MSEVIKENLEEQVKIIEENTPQPEDYENEYPEQGWADSDNDLI